MITIFSAAEGSTERLSNLTNVTQLLSDKSGIWNQTSKCPPLASVLDWLQESGGRSTLNTYLQIIIYFTTVISYTKGNFKLLSPLQEGSSHCHIGLFALPDLFTTCQCYSNIYLPIQNAILVKYACGNGLRGGGGGGGGSCVYKL